MAKTKKEKVEEKVVAKALTKDIEAELIDSCKYAGNVSMSVVNGHKIVTKKKLHNAGGIKLFEFLAKCLIGVTAEADRPLKVKLFYNKGTTVDAATTNIANWTNITQETDYVVATTSGELSSSTEALKQKEKYDVAILHFRIPFVVLQNDPGKYNQICLYGKDCDNDSEYSAYYLITDDTDTTKISTISLNDFNKNFNIIIDWTMTISN